MEPAGAAKDKPRRGWLSGCVSRLLIALLRAYQLLISPWLGTRCRHMPSCSAYAQVALERYGPMRGGWLTIKRLVRCQPWGTAGYDPVPETEPVDSRRTTREL